MRTYRGRTLAEILPRVREELGEDAVILREREGLVGGVGGFFAQRFIEVEAAPGDASTIDIYDEPDLDEPDMADAAADSAPAHPALPEPADTADTERAEGTADPLATADAAATADAEVTADAEDTEAESAAPASPGAAQDDLEQGVERLPEVRVKRLRERSTTAQAGPPEPASDKSTKQAAERPPEAGGQSRQQTPQARPRVRAGALETEVFLERLRAASAALTEQDEPLQAPEEAAPAPGESEGTLTPSSAPARAPRRRQQTQPRANEPRARRQPQRKPPAGPQPSRPQAPEREGAAATPALSPRARTSLQHTTPPPLEPPRAAPTPPTPPQPAQMGPARAAATQRLRPPSLRTGLPTESPAERAGAAAAAPIATPATPSPAHGAPSPQSDALQKNRGVLALLRRLLGRRGGDSDLPRPSPPKPLDQEAAAAIRRALLARGASEEWASRLIATAAAHGRPFAAELREAAVAEIARAVLPAPALPAAGAAVAFIGAGGAGKTRCTAALARAYSSASTLGVTVVTLADRAGQGQLERMLRPDGVPVLAPRRERASQVIKSARAEGFVVVDTPTATPTDAASVQELAALLEPFALDATFVALPATLGAQAARRALTGFAPLDPTAIAITHADETDQLAVAVEIAIDERIPLAYLHAGTDHRTALTAVEAQSLARRLLLS